MREILFRGKRKDNGRWIFGDLIHRQVWMSEIMIIRTGDNGFDVYTEYEVIPQTVGQYTGLTDMNGKKIFEGDIVKRQFNDFTSHIYTVEFNYGEFKLVSVTTKGKMFISCHSECEIIGNIYDNPELIKSEKEND